MDLVQTECLDSCHTLGCDKEADARLVAQRLAEHCEDNQDNLFMCAGDISIECLRSGSNFTTDCGLAGCVLDDPSRPPTCGTCSAAGSWCGNDRSLYRCSAAGASPEKETCPSSNTCQDGNGGASCVAG